MPFDRDKAMDRIQEIDKELAQLEEDVDNDWDYCGAERSIFQCDIYELTEERNELLRQFPEVRFWPE